MTTQQIAELFAYAQAVAPEECCGLLGGVGGQVGSIYPLRNVAEQPRRAYEAAPDELFAAQRAMRGRGEKLLGIYHSHPEQQEPQPSLTDVRLAFYPSAAYFIIGLGAEAVLRAFRLDEAAGGWERVEYEVKAE